MIMKVTATKRRASRATTTTIVSEDVEDAGGGNVEPGGGNVESGEGNVEPGGGNVEPGGGNVESGEGNAEPGGGNVEPGGGNVEPGGGNVEPGGGNVETGVGVVLTAGNDGVSNAVFSGFTTAPLDSTEILEVLVGDGMDKVISVNSKVEESVGKIIVDEVSSIPARIEKIAFNIQYFTLFKYLLMTAVTRGV